MEVYIGDFFVFGIGIKIAGRDFR